MRRVAIEGASGYSGMELCRLVAGHPQLELVAATSGRWAGQPLGQHVAVGGADAGLCFEQSVGVDVELAFLATPAEASETLAASYRDAGVLVVDLSDAFRFSADAVYGLTEFARAELAGATLIANPGCYPTATQLALIPLVQAGLIAEGPVIVDAKSGVTGAGRRLDESLLFNELADNHYPYKVGVHRHVPEIERGVGRPVVFTPHLLPTRRGLLISAYLTLRSGVTVEQLREVLHARYDAEPFVQIVSADSAIGIAGVVGRPLCRIAVAPTIKAGIARVFASLDNLLKGAASQAMQNANCALGYAETTGLL